MENKSISKSEKFKRIGEIGLGVILIIAMITMIIVYVANGSGKKKNDTVSKADSRSRTEYVEIEKEVEVEVEKEISNEILEDGLRDMGVMVTEEYYFTQVENYSKTKKVMKFFESESNFIYSYDGTVGAGIDFTKIKVDKNADTKVVTVRLPASEVQYVDIDFNSFKVYAEKEGLWNPIKVTDYNESLVDMKKTAEEHAISKGTLNRADESARLIIESFINGLLDDPEYRIDFVS